MSAETASVPAGAKAGGLAVMAGMVSTIVAALFFPGGPLIDSVDQTDFPAAAAALGAKPELSHAMTLLVILGMLLYCFGFVELLRLRGRGAGLSAAVLRFGILASLFSWCVFIIGIGVRHGAIYLMEQGIRAGDGTELQAEFAGLAVASQITMMGVLLSFMVVNPIASALVGIGLAARLNKPDIYLLAAYALIIIGLGGFAGVALALFLADTNVAVFLSISQVFLFIGSLCLFVIGAGMYRGRREFVAEDAAS